MSGSAPLSTWTDWANRESDGTVLAAHSGDPLATLLVSIVLTPKEYSNSAEHLAVLLPRVSKNNKRERDKPMCGWGFSCWGSG